MTVQAFHTTIIHFNYPFFWKWMQAEEKQLKGRKHRNVRSGEKKRYWYGLLNDNQTYNLNTL